MKLTRRYHFNASHRLHAASLNVEENQQLFGKCNNPYGHGHNYTLDVTVAGKVEEHTGQVVNIPELDQFVKHAVIRDFDHRNLNEDLDDFAGLVPTTENLAVRIVARLREGWTAQFGQRGIALEKIRIHETPRNIFELRNI